MDNVKPINFFNKQLDKNDINFYNLFENNNIKKKCKPLPVKIYNVIFVDKKVIKSNL